MADDLAATGRLSPEEYEAARQWVDSHWSNSVCPFHGETQWELETALGEIPMFTPQWIPTSSRTVFPLLILTCAYCGFTVTVNALKAGILKRPPAETGLSPTNDPPQEPKAAPSTAAGVASDT
jgi:hypothetical protein